jgi:hypothetical protein
MNERFHRQLEKIHRHSLVHHHNFPYRIYMVLMGELNRKNEMMLEVVMMVLQ